jgi:hypothetical protein
MWHGNGVLGLPDLGLFSAFKNINGRNSERSVFGVSSVDSFISGEYGSFSSLHQSLFSPFSNWAQNAGGGDLEGKLSSLKYLGFSKKYTTYSSNEYIFKTPYKVESFAEYGYVNAPIAFPQTRNFKFESFDYVHRQQYKPYKMERHDTPSQLYTTG